MLYLNHRLSRMMYSLKMLRSILETVCCRNFGGICCNWRPRTLNGFGQNHHWLWVIPTLQLVLHGESQQITPFRMAWGFMYAVTVRLDHLQDHDPVVDPLPTDQPNAQYNLIFAYYVLATSLLDDLAHVGLEV